MQNLILHCISHKTPKVLYCSPKDLFLIVRVITVQSLASLFNYLWTIPFCLLDSPSSCQSLIQSVQLFCIRKLLCIILFHCCHLLICGKWTALKCTHFTCVLNSWSKWANLEWRRKLGTVYHIKFGVLWKICGKQVSCSGVIHWFTKQWIHSKTFLIFKRYSNISFSWIVYFIL